MAPNSTALKEPIAIIGTGCHFAGDVDSPSKLWELLREPKDARQEIPASRFNINGFYHPNAAHHGRGNVKHSYLLNTDPSLFDAEFFRINPIESKAMDPQQRLLLETVYESIESAGLTIEGLRGSDTAVFAGVMIGDYEAMLVRDLDDIPTYCAVGTSRAVLSNRVSYFFDWHGPSVTVDTACSSSLVAVHMAIQSLRGGDSRIAIACGSNVILGPENYIIESKVKMLSPDGLSRMWDKDANGYARGDGVAAIVLKPLAAAIADNDHIECVIRETALNQDGQTPGLTMPSPTAQRALIQKVYNHAGLDLAVHKDRPQFFEAHGTGTPAGDPVEAEAISTAFFGGEKGTEPVAEHNATNPLLVGSIKTVLGHTEGTAGIAAVLKAMLAIRHSTIPPNLLLNELNPAVAPFYKNLKIPTVAKPWPKLAAGIPRRASVNSFGFGGANAHAILESFDADKAQPNNHLVVQSKVTPFTPFVFSAASESSLRANLAAYLAYLEEHPDVNLHDLAYTLRDRRSTFTHRVAIPATDKDTLQEKIKALVQDGSAPVGLRVPEKETPGKILAVFTGQGAQYARMAAELITRSPLAKRIIQTLESHLAQLPADDRPRWSLEAEILADETHSRLGESEISQPLNTAVQILLVDLLRAAKIQFSGIVGHSGGEVAAAYAAGFLSARDALTVAYYRGVNCAHATSPNRCKQGAMLAIGTSMEDAQEIVSDEVFEGRIALAAVNSSASVTISGDDDAIDELTELMATEERFHRRLKVDKAYHSKHMLPCAEPYIEGVRRAGVKALVPPSSNKSVWFSSVFDGKPVDMSYGLSDTYWAENMVRPVLFAQALTSALSSGIQFDAVLEIGPHAALKSPSIQTMQDVLGKSLPYHGTLTRKMDSIEAWSASLGFVWSNLGGSSLNLEQAEQSLAAEPKPAYCVLKGLPTYRWNHATSYWHESRRSRFLRTRANLHHPLLGDPSPDSGTHALRWKNILKPSDLDWLEGHSVQNQLVFPASGYVSTALEAALVLAGQQEIRLIDLDDFHIAQAVTFPAGNVGVEVQIELAQILKPSSRIITARFIYSAALGSSTELSLAAEGFLKITLGVPSSSLLPHRQPAPPHMIPVEHSRLYKYMESLEYNFTGPFRSLIDNKRKLGTASCIANRAQTSDSDEILLHPIDLDAAFQSVNLAYSYPGDDQLRNLHLPTTISKIRVNPAVFAETKKWSAEEGSMHVDSVCNPEDRSSPGSGFSGNINVYLKGCSNTAVQVEQVQFKPVGMEANENRQIFSRMDYVLMQPDGDIASNGIPTTQEEAELLWVLSRIVNFYARQFDLQVPEDSQMRSEAPTSHYLRFCRHLRSLFEKGETPFAKQEWLHDTVEDVKADIEKKGVGDRVDTRIMQLVGETMPKVFRGETTMLEQFRNSNLLDDYYAYGMGTGQSSMWLGNITKQITDRHPHLKILEIGAGTGGATKHILKSIGHDFDSYTFTDISSSFFESAADVFAEWGDQMIYKPCDAEQDVLQQGFAPGEYDVIVACQVLHATKSLEETCKNLRKLLKPGGYLLIGEGSSEGMCPLGAGFIFGTLPGWWAGVDEGRVLSPLGSASQWDSVLRASGFSGINTSSPQRLFDAFGVILMVSQAVDSAIRLTQEPLASVSNLALDTVALVGGQTVHVSKMVDDLERIFIDFGKTVHRYRTVETLDDKIMFPGTGVINLAEFDKPLFRDMTEEGFLAVKKLYEGDKSILWLTKGRLTDDPYCNVSVGFGRAAAHEDDSLHLQFLDVPDLSRMTAERIAEAFVRLCAPQLRDERILYPFEKEVIINEEGKELVPRLGQMDAANDRLNSTRKQLTHEVDLQSNPVELQQTASECSIRKLTRWELEHDEQERTCIDMTITYSLLSAIRTAVGHRFLVFGTDPNGQHYLALTPHLMSRIKVPAECAIRFEGARISGDELVTLTAAEIVAINILDPLNAGEKLAAHNTPPTIIRAVTRHATSKGVCATFTLDHNHGDAEGEGRTYSLDHNHGDAEGDWKRLPLFLGRAELAKAIPADISCFVGLSAEGNTENEQAIVSELSPYCRKENVKTLFSQQAFISAGSSQAVLRRILEKAVQGIEQDGEKAFSKPNTIPLQELVSTNRPDDPLTVVQWSSPGVLPARVTRYDMKPLFKQDKTYWLCGLSGALGISLCDWMIERGMRNIVITSRNPKIDPTWIENHGKHGARIETMPCDVTNESNLRDVHRRIVKTFPPIAGALNGAMVLRDVSVHNMTYEQAMTAIRPKVLGSIHLDRIFHDEDLDFFILLSSASCIIGNVGQANYAAGNMGMCAVAAHRRKRGLRSSVANVGAIIGVGYITDSVERLDLTVVNTRLTHLSEEDFHQIFAEVYEAGYLDSAAGPEITTGIMDVSSNEPNMPKWFTDPKFSRFIVYDRSTGGPKEEGINNASILEDLEVARTKQDIFDVVKRAFAAQLRKTLQISTTDDEILEMRGASLGLDSLIAVDIRSWFLKIFKVSIPVLKIMAGDAQMSSLVQAAVDDIPVELTPLIPRAEIQTSVPDSEAPTSHDTDTIGRSAIGLSPSTVITTPPASQSSDEDKTPNNKKKDGIDWDAEITPPPDLEAGTQVNSKPPKRHPEVVLLTGATGLLGHHLLNSLLEQPSIRKVICVAIRHVEDRIESKELPPPTNRIQYYEGDLAQEGFGLTEEEQTAIFDEVDAVIHNGSDTSHLKYYYALKESNVESTKQLIRLCLPRMIPLHYISSAGMALFAGMDAFPPVSGTKTGRQPPTDGSHGYMCGKWVCESLLENVQARYGLDVWIQRPSTIVREGADATTAKADFDWVNSLFYYSHKIQAVPKIEHNAGAFDLVTIKTCCEDIVGELVNNEPKSPNSVTYVNNVGDRVIPMADMDHIAKDMGHSEPYAVLPWAEWTEKAANAGLHPAVAALIETFDAPETDSYPALLRERI